MRTPSRPRHYFTLLVLRDEGQITRLRVSSRTLQLLLIPLVLLLGLGIFLTIDYIRTKIEVARLEGGARPAATAAVPAPAKAGLTPAVAATPPLTNAELWKLVDTRIMQFAPADRFFAAQRFDSFAVPERWPVKGWILRQFGRRFNRQSQQYEANFGIDIAAPIGTDVYAAANGVVLQTVDDPRAGRYVVIRHGHGLTTVYGHLEHVLAVPSQSVRGGDVIGKVGVTNDGAGGYVHYETRLFNVPINPYRYLPGGGLAM